MRKLLVSTLIFFGFLSAVAWTGAYLSTPGTAEDGVFSIESGEGVDSITGRLEDAGIVRSAVLFRLALFREGVSTRLQPGTYDISGVGTYGELARLLSTGGIRADEVVVRIIEGWDLFDIAEHLGSLGLMEADELYSVTGDPGHELWKSSTAGGMDLSDRFAFLADKPWQVSLEGYLFPDTYRVFSDDSAEDMVVRFLTNFGNRITPELLSAVEDSGHTLFEIVTMASVIEKEVRSEDDMKMVSDIFWRRYELGMALQACSTVNYVTRKDLPAVEYEDTMIDSPYNSYKYRGLPLGPICNPGISAITAAIYPEPNDYWYFMSDSEGNVHYGRDLDEHNANKFRYLK